MRERINDGMETLTHGAHTTYQPHIGICLTDDEDAARSYARQGGAGEIATVEIDLDELTVITLDEGYDFDENEAPADRDPESYGCDVIIYDDCDIGGAEHQTWRLVSQRAVDALTTISVVSADDEEEE